MLGWLGPKGKDLNRRRN